MNGYIIFRDRREAGRLLGERLRELGMDDQSLVLVLALPRGGVPVAYEVARALGALPWICSWCASWARRGRKSWRWDPSPWATCRS